MTNSPTSDTIVLAWARLVRAQQVVVAAVERDLKAAGFPQLAWYDVLLELNRAGLNGLRPHEIETRLLIAQHNVSRLLDRLEQAGLLSREACETDGRGQIIKATPQGLALLRRMWPTYAKAIQRHVGDKLTETDVETLARLLGSLVERQPQSNTP